MLELAFVNGILAAFGSLIAEMLLLAAIPGSAFSLDGRINFDSSIGLVIAAAAIEESFKAFFILRTSNDRRAGQAGLLKAALSIGIGFFSIELLFKRSLLSAGSAPSFLGIFLVHLATAAVFAWSARNVPDRKSTLIFPLLLNIAIHVGYNLWILGLA